MKWILFIYLSTFGTEGGVSITSAEFASKEACEVAAAKARDAFDTVLTQEPETLCLNSSTGEDK